MQFAAIAIVACLAVFLAPAQALSTLGCSLSQKFPFGADCTSNGDCCSNYCSDTTAPKCLKGGANSPCDVANDCISGVCLPSGKCSTSAYTRACYLNSDCTGTNICLDGTCVMKGAIANGKLAAGAVCENKEQCASNICYNSRCMPQEIDDLCDQSFECLSQDCSATGHCKCSTQGLPCHLNTDCCTSVPSGRPLCIRVYSTDYYGTCGVIGCMDANLQSTGETCTKNDECCSNACVDGFCLPGNAGEKCDIAGDCISGNCVGVNNPATPEDGTCALSAKLGTCFVDTDCNQSLVPLYCVDGVCVA